MNIRSMTGYGKTESVAGDRKITVEIRSLNSKQLDLSVRIPALFRPMEYDIRNRIGKMVQRGKTDVFITCENLKTVLPANINRDIFNEYYSQLAQLGHLSEPSEGKPLDTTLMSAVLRLPEVVTGESPELTEEDLQLVMDTVDKALAMFDEFRRQEGEALVRDLLLRIEKIEQYRCEVEPYEVARTHTIKERIREHIQQAGITLDENRLEQEMIYYIEKLDITEEKVRLDNHCRYFRDVVENEENAGRKLGFIAQEMGREINTLGSKANDSEIQRLVVGMKDELEKIKEQVLNIL